MYVQTCTYNKYTSHTPCTYAPTCIYTYINIKNIKITLISLTDFEFFSCLFQLYADGKPSHFIDANDSSQSNWMRYVNCARTESEQNLMAYQHRGAIFYRTFTPIAAGTELLTWYGQDYGKELGINKGFYLEKVVNGQGMYA
jgi:hypothetical protein